MHILYTYTQIIMMEKKLRLSEKKNEKKNRKKYIYIYVFVLLL